ncbi:MAG: DUF2165 family protein [Pseudomonadota bacterium]
MTQNAKILLAALVALWGLIGAAGNFAHIGIAYAAVAGVTSMPMFPADAAPPWRTEAPLVVWAGVSLIIAGKLAAFLFCSIGVISMTKSRRDVQAFRHAKRWALTGCALAVAMLFGGFIVLGESLWVMFRNPEYAPAADAAFRYGGFIALIAIFIAQDDA